MKLIRRVNSHRRVSDRYVYRAKPVTPDSSLSEKRHPSANLQTSYKRLTICIILVFATLVAVIISVIFTLSPTETKESDGNDDGVQKDNASFWLGPHEMYTRKEWGAEKPHSVRPLSHPTEFVVVSHTVGRFCRDLTECATTMRAMQENHMNQPLNADDIGYNFVIGGDANIYVGRDWDYINFHRNYNVGICFTGDFSKMNLTDDMISALVHLMDFGVKLKKLSADYKLVCHSQTANTESPGVNACRQISQLPHYVPGKVEIG